LPRWTTAVVCRIRFLATNWEVNLLKSKTVVKRIGIAVLAITFLFSVIPGTQARHLQTEMRVYFNPKVFVDPSEPIWNGTVSGDIDGTMLFWATGPIPPKDLGLPPDFPWRVHFFTERWVITDEEGDKIYGVDQGVTGSSNWLFRMNGVVTDATGKYEELVGHQVHMNGQIEWANVFVEGVAIGPIIIN
jgi:hypothetical protein